MRKFLASIMLCTSLSLALIIPAFAEGNSGSMRNNGATTLDDRTFIGTTATDNNRDGVFDGRANGVNNRMNTYNTNGRNGNYRARAAANGDNDVDWGWLGLLGLIGLAGLRNKNREGAS